MPSDFNKLSPAQQNAVFDKYHDLFGRPPRNTSELRDWYGGMAEHSQQGNETALDDVFNVPRYAEYKLAGGQNYREHRITKPELKTTPPEIQKLQDRMDEFGSREKRRYNDVPGQGALTPEEHELLMFYNRNKAKLAEDSYKSQHWDEPNVLGHLRLTDRDVETPKGESTPALHLEELQSDWAQDIRNRGERGEAQELLKKQEAGTITKDEAKRLDKIIKHGTTGGLPPTPFKSTPAWAGLLLKWNSRYPRPRQ